MSKWRLLPLPQKGIDARASMQAPQDSFAYSQQIRNYNQDIQHLTDNNSTLPSPSNNVGTARNLVQFFMSPPGGPDQNRLIMFTTQGAWMANNALSTWAQLEAYAMSSITIFAGAVTYGRYAWANSGHKLCWTCTRTSTPTVVRVYDGTTVTTIAQQYAAEHMIAFNHRIVIANTVETGVRNAARVRWCANRNFTDWSGTGSGFMEVGSNVSSGAIRALVNYDDFALLSLENEIIELVPTNSLFPVFEEGTHYNGTPIMSSQTWQVMNHIAFFLGADTVYAWDRSKFTPIGRPIEPLLKPLLQPLRSAFGMQGIAYPARGEYHLLASEGTRAGTSTAMIFIYDVNADRWFLDVPPAVSTIGRVSVQYQEQAYVQPLVNVAAPQEFTMRTNGFDTIGMEERAVNYPTSSPPPTGLIDTQDIYALDLQDQPSPNAKNDLLAFYFQAKPGQSYTVACSIDSGVTWIGAAVVVVNADGLGKFSFRMAFRKIRFRLQAVADYFNVTGVFQLEYDQAGENY